MISSLVVVHLFLRALFSKTQTWSELTGPSRVAVPCSGSLSNDASTLNVVPVFVVLFCITPYDWVEGNHFLFGMKPTSTHASFVTKLALLP